MTRSRTFADCPNSDARISRFRSHGCDEGDWGRGLTFSALRAELMVSSPLGRPGVSDPAAFSFWVIHEVDQIAVSAAMQGLYTSPPPDATTGDARSIDAFRFGALLRTRLDLMSSSALLIT